MDTASFKRIFATVADALGTTPMLDARVLRQLLAGPVEYKSGATATARDAVLADLRQREWQLQTEEAWAAVFEAKSLLGAAG